MKHLFIIVLFICIALACSSCKQTTNNQTNEPATPSEAAVPTPAQNQASKDYLLVFDECVNLTYEPTETREPRDYELSEAEAKAELNAIFALLGLNDFACDNATFTFCNSLSGCGWWSFDNEEFWGHIDAKSGLLMSLELNGQSLPDMSKEGLENIAREYSKTINERLDNCYVWSDYYSFNEFIHEFDSKNLWTVRSLSFPCANKSLNINIEDGEITTPDGKRAKQKGHINCVHFCARPYHIPNDREKLIYNETELIELEEDKSPLTKTQIESLLWTELEKLNGTLPQKITSGEYSIKTNEYKRIVTNTNMQKLWRIELESKQGGTAVLIYIDPEEEFITMVSYDELGKTFKASELTKIVDSYVEDYYGYYHLFRHHELATPEIDSRTMQYPKFNYAGAFFYDDFADVDENWEKLHRSGVCAVSCEDGSFKLYFTTAYQNNFLKS